MQIEISKFISSYYYYYFSTLGEALGLFVPFKSSVVPTLSADQQKDYEALLEKDRALLFVSELSFMV